MPKVPKAIWNYDPDKYWELDKEAHEFIEGVKLHNHRFLAIDYITKMMKKGKTLDIGCGERALGSWANIDNECPIKIPENFQVMDAHHLDFPDNSFDAISIIEVIEHVENPSQVFREIYRVLKKDGILFLTTPNPCNLSIFIRYARNRRIRVHCHHINAWHWESLAWFMHNMGFRDIEVFLWGHIDQMMKEDKPVKLYRSYRLANLLYRLGIRNPMLHLNIFIKCRK